MHPPTDLRRLQNTRMSMDSKFFSRIAKPTVVGLLAFSSVALVSGVFAVSQASAQENATSAQTVEQAPAEKKMIHEPVFRVPNEPSSAVAVATPDRVANIPKTNIPNVTNDNVPNRKQKTQAILPSAVKPVPAPIAEPGDPEAPNVAPTVDPAPGKKIPAIPASAVKRVPHPLDDALETAKRGLENIRANVQDYSAILVKRERINGELQKPEYMQVKVRSERVSDSGQKTPFGIYIKFLKPRACAGREVIWVKGQNDNKLVVHEAPGTIMGLRTFQLEPDSWLAMKGQRYPVYEAGMENLVVKLIEKAERDRAAGNCEVEYRSGVSINGRDCDVIEVTHPEEKAPYDFHIAKIYIDTELKLPIRYQAHIWPKPGSTKPQLLEEYTYLRVKLNQGFTDEDFNSKNPKYSYP